MHSYTYTVMRLREKNPYAGLLIRSQVARVVHLPRAHCRPIPFVLSISPLPPRETGHFYSCVVAVSTTPVYPYHHRTPSVRSRKLPQAQASLPTYLWLSRASAVQGRMSTHESHPRKSNQAPFFFNSPIPPNCTHYLDAFGIRSYMGDIITKLRGHY